MPKTDPTKLLRNQHLEKAFGVTSMTLFLWRGGTPTKTALPTADTDSRLVAYNPKQVEAWAKKNGVTLLVPDLAGLLAGGTVVAAKPGPKAKIASAKAPTSKIVKAVITDAAAVMKNVKRIPKLPSAAAVAKKFAPLVIPTKAARASPKRVTTVAT